MRPKTPSVITDGLALGKPLWWGVHHDERGIERERRSFRTRREARAWVKEMKAKERGELAA